MSELELLKQAAGFGPEQEQWLRRTRDVLDDQAEALVDHWRKVLGAQPHLAAYSSHRDGRPNPDYSAASGPRFVQWVRDTCMRPRDQAWLDYQEEIGLRHTPAKKNQTDGVHTPPVVPLRYLIAFVAVVNPIRPFLCREKRSAEEIEEMQNAWSKAVLIQISLWSRPYVKEGLW